MCRFLVARSKYNINMQSIIKDFAFMAQKSRTHDGDRQADGWGVAWLADSKWKSFKSLKPIWQDFEIFKNIPKTKLLVVHARSATYTRTIGEIEFNQPFVNGEYVYVFNGHLRGVRLRRAVDGNIGSQKIWSLIKKEMKSKSAFDVLDSVYQLVKQNTKQIIGLNIGIISTKGMLFVSNSEKDDEYFRLRVAKTKDKILVCSEEIGKYNFTKMKQGKIIAV